MKTFRMVRSAWESLMERKIAEASHMETLELEQEDYP